ncbi:MAG: hypothetical protein AB1626_02765 [Candidatus Micrarchaeota archaeon]
MKKARKVICKKCRQPAEEVVLDSYEYLEGIPLQSVRALECPRCKQFVFTPEQVEEMEARTETIKAHLFGFKRKVTVSGRSLVINLPEDLARHMHIIKGKIVNLLPLDDKRFLVETRT